MIRELLWNRMQTSSSAHPLSALWPERVRLRYKVPRMLLRTWMLLPLLACASIARGAEPTVVVVMFGGFAADYVEMYSTPALDQMRKEGAWSQDMEPTFPSVSLTNAVSISTGCWPEHHGIVTNRFMDPEHGTYDHDANADWLTSCEHMHQAAERQGVRSATLGWVGGHSRSRGPQATVVLDPPDPPDSPDDDSRASQVLELLRWPAEKRPRLILAYFHGPDAAGHFFGVDSRETERAVQGCDATVAKIREAIAALPDAKDIYFAVTTDQGMAPVTAIVNVKRILSRNGIDAQTLSTGTTSMLYFDDPSEIDEAERVLSTYDAFRVVRKDAQPASWHLGTGPRVGDLILSARPPYFMEDMDSWPWYARWMQWAGPDLVRTDVLRATHGFPPGTPGMSGIFYVVGPGIAPDTRLERMRAVDIHATILSLLGVQAGSPNDGKVRIMPQVSRSRQPEPADPSAQPITPAAP
jgi:predicted AlkP superfamily pyrophosphatase or phosphodiesterase